MAIDSSSTLGPVDLQKTRIHVPRNEPRCISESDTTTRARKARHLISAEILKKLQRDRHFPHCLSIALGNDALNQPRKKFLHLKAASHRCIPIFLPYLLLTHLLTDSGREIAIHHISHGREPISRTDAEVREYTYRSGDLNGLCKPDFGTALRFCTKDCASSNCVSGHRTKRSCPFKGSGSSMHFSVPFH